MPDMENPLPTVPESKIVFRKPARFSFVWLVPIFATLIGVWIGVNTLRNEGPKITIEFHSAEGLEAGKTKIRYNGVEVGVLSDIRLSKDYQKVIATAKMSPQTENFLATDTQFWVVRPQISGATISGLSTLISGPYIGMQIGQSKLSQRHYEALDDAPLETGGIHGRFFTLKTPQLGSLYRGAPLYFRRLQAGKVAAYDLDKDGKFLNVKVFVKEPYDHFVTSDTRFWQASGIDVSLSASGLKVQTESLLSILVGGIAFETPETSSQLPPAAENAEFALCKDREEAFWPPAVNPYIYTIAFKGSVRGLAIGAPVEIDGIPIGKVTDMHPQLNTETYEYSVPVTVQIDPARFGVKLLGLVTNQWTFDDHRKLVDAMIARGLRAQLQTGNLITGARFIALDFFPDAAPARVDWSQTPVELPSVPSQFQGLEGNLASIVKKINQMPLNEIGTNLNLTIVRAQGALTNADQLLAHANQLIAPDSALDAQLGALIQQLGGAAQAISLLADYLERHPEALIRGKSGGTQ
ncbi:MAG TPA: MlaD family protein [Candidatus Acidoferrales bacterium]|nr:MlaD family protein [Candidatus Acidoferrales bacterium]